jgi:hypothetical protein
VRLFDGVEQIPDVLGVGQVDGVHIPSVDV